MKPLKILLILIVAILFVSCTEQVRTRTFGGSTTINVEQGKRVMMATWKENDLFYMVEDMPDDYIPHNKYLIESSSWGILESTIIFKESK